MGKTALVEKLASLGYCFVEESGRVIIREEMRRKGTLLPWIDPKGFAMEMWNRSIHDYLQAFVHKKYTFFDRAIPDVIGDLRLCKLEAPQLLFDLATRYRYNQQVFIAPPWPAIYQQDSERRQTHEQAIATYQKMVEIYQELDYRLNEIPRTTVLKRADFLRNAVQK